ncbi:MAG: LacI family transcriptional regulator [Runella slithyformis]|nr:MAG: LacI family transcriptional regulator [Runella slithyformis]TAF25897.1 MAG: LacI family transcriptional regulator [Runella slithyformis]TAF43923.1 MAG: LacI family transcriptional regulator [Runella slithyformis]TAF80779.1 MAG: LacI family transcriptional regulator [Runella slithyformis]
MKTNTSTIKEIAYQLGLSTSTVSRALRGLSQIKPETRAAVVRVAEELDYQPNMLAKSLAKSHTKTIGLVVPSLNYYFFSSVLQSIEETALQAGYSVMICQTGESYLREVSQIQNLLNSKVEGFIISLSRDTSQYEHIERLVRKKIPVVLFDRYIEGLEASKVIVDNQLAAFQATEHLIENGCKRLGFLAGPPNLLISNQRVEGFKAALQQHQLPFQKRYVLHSDFSQENTMMQTFNLMNLPDAPDGLLVMSDRIAFAAMHALKQRGLRIPADVAVVSFNNEPTCDYLTPSLTSVSQPIQDMGREAVRLLLKQLDTDNLLPETTILPTQLVVRGSSIRSEVG